MFNSKDLYKIAEGKKLNPDAEFLDNLGFLKMRKDNDLFESLNRGVSINKKSIADLSKGREKPMVTGIAEIIRMVDDLENRKRIAEHQVRQFKREGIEFNYAEFLELCKAV
jgi:hypothetical protein